MCKTLFSKGNAAAFVSGLIFSLSLSISIFDDILCNSQRVPNCAERCVFSSELAATAAPFFSRAYFTADSST